METERTSKPSRWVSLTCASPHVTQSKASFHQGASSSFTATCYHTCLFCYEAHSG